MNSNYGQYKLFEILLLQYNVTMDAITSRFTPFTVVGAMIECGLSAQYSKTFLLIFSWMIYKNEETYKIRTSIMP